MDVLYSPDERYAAVSSNSTIYLYDLRQNAELRREAVPNPFAPLHGGMAAFDAASRHFYFLQGFKLQQCTLGMETACKTIREPVVGLFAIDAANQIAYVSAEHVPSLMRAEAPEKPVTFAETVPSADLDDLTWRHIGLRGTPGRNAQIVLAGTIDRRMKAGNKSTTSNEWRVSVFDAGARTTLVNYVTVPVSVDNSWLAADGHVLLCGQDQAELSKNELRDTMPPMRYYDLALRKYLTGAEMARVPKAFETACTEPVNNVLSLAPRSAAQTGTGEAAIRGLKSPSGKLLIGTRAMQQMDGQVLYLRQLAAPYRTAVLGAALDPLRQVGIIPPALLWANGMFSNYQFDFASGNVGYLPEDARYAPGVRGAFFFPVGSTGSWYLHFLNRDGGITREALNLRTFPEWHGVSADGNVVVYQIRSGVYRYANGKSTKLPCSSLVDFSSGRHPVLDPSHKQVGAFCDAEGSDGHFAPHFVVWDLASGQEAGKVPAEGFSGAAAFAWERSRVVLAGKRGIRTAALQPASHTDLPLRSLKESESVVQLGVQANPPAMVLGIHDVGSGNASIVWFDPAGKVLERADWLGRMEHLACSINGTVTVLRSDNVVSLYSNARKRILQLIATGGGDWLAFSEEGMFDGTAGALEWAGIRRARNGPLLTASLYFNELYAPGLLNRIARNMPPQLPTGIGLDTYLDLPGLKLLLENRELTPQVRSGKAVVCVARPDLFARLRERELPGEEDADAGCPRRITLSDQSNPRGLVAALEQLGKAGRTTPWDTIKLSAPPKTVHVLSVAVSRYGRNELPDIPSAVPASQALGRAIAARAPGGNIVDWADKCGGPLVDSKAGKAAILACFAKLNAAAGPDDMVVLSFAGHGGTTGQSEMFHFYPYSGAGEIEQLSAAELADELRRLTPRRVVLIVDACESGAALGTLEQVAVAKASLAASLNAEQAQGILLLAAASGLEAAKGTATSNPFLDRLTQLLLQGPALSARSLASELRKPLGSSAGGADAQLQPLAIVVGADFEVSALK